MLICHYDTARESAALGTQGLATSAISCEPHINSRMMQGGRPRARACTRQGDNRRGETGDQGSHGDMKSSDSRPGVATLINGVRGVAHFETRADVGYHRFWS